MLRLVVVAGEGKDEDFVFDKSSVALGKSSDNDVCLDDPYISRHHARIARVGKQWVYRDLGSTNGSVIEQHGERLRLDATNPKAVLEAGSLIHVGQTVLQVEIEIAARAATSPQHTVVAHCSLAGLAKVQQRAPREFQHLLVAQKLDERLTDASDPEEMLDMVLEALLEAFPQATHAIILLVDRATGLPKRKAARIRGEVGGRKEDVPISMSIANRVLKEGESLLFNDVAAEFQDSRSVVSAGIRCCLCTPLWTGQETVGLVQVENRSGGAAFAEEDLGRLGLFAGKAALGIIAAQLRAAESRNKRLQDLSARLIPSFIQTPGASQSRSVRAIDASVLFSDIRGFTGAAERLSVTDTLTMLAAYHATVEDIVDKHGGTIVKIPGDAVLAIFWKETEEGSHALCALRCGEEILDDLPRVAKLWEEMGAALAVGVGVNAGEVAVGMVGKRHLEPTVVGDPVNVAQRLESITKTLQCPLLFSESIRERLPAEVEITSLDEIAVAGRERPLKIYTLARLAPGEQTRTC